MTDQLRRFGDFLISLGLVTETQVLEALALQPLTGKGMPIAALDGTIEPSMLEKLAVDVVATTADAETLRALRQGLAARNGALVPLVSEAIYPAAYAHERAVCVDTTAAGGNASLLAAA